jgi:GDP-4-dehydro-6-deoxy-D-mannose reductase
LSNRPGLLVTGASGFVGRRVIATGRRRFDIVATGRGARPDWLPSNVSWCAVDLLSRSSVAGLPTDLPFVLHLASETVPAQFSSYDPLLDSVEMTLNLCRHLRAGRLLFASSCLVYGASREPLTERSRVAPRGNYGLAKLMGENVVLRSSVIEAVVARPFNHIGWGMRPDLAIPSIVQRVRKNGGDAATIEMAGLDSIRDFLDVDDIVEAYFAILTLDKPSNRIFNVCSGRPTSIGEVVSTVAGILNKPISQVVFSEKANSADDTSIVVGNAALLQTATGWSPKYDLRESLRRLIAGPDTP